MTIAVAFGALRSGSTMLRLMIEGHSGMACSGEHDFLFDHLVEGPGDGWHYDLDALTERAWAQQRLLVNAPTAIDEAMVRELFRASLSYW